MEQRRQDVQGRYPVMRDAPQSVHGSPQLPGDGRGAVAVTTVVRADRYGFDE